PKWKPRRETRTDSTLQAAGRRRARPDLHVFSKPGERPSNQNRAVYSSMNRNLAVSIRRRRHEEETRCSDPCRWLPRDRLGLCLVRRVGSDEPVQRLRGELGEGRSDRVRIGPDDRPSPERLLEVPGDVQDEVSGAARLTAVDQDEAAGCDREDRVVRASLP